MLPVILSEKDQSTSVAALLPALLRSRSFAPLHVLAHVSTSEARAAAVTTMHLLQGALVLVRLRELETADVVTAQPVVLAADLQPGQVVAHVAEEGPAK